MAAPRSPARRDRGRPAAPAWLTSAATRQRAQEADAAMERGEPAPDPAKPNPPAPPVANHLYFLP